jgi:hypothetical protein
MSRYQSSARFQRLVQLASKSETRPLDFGFPAFVSAGSSGFYAFLLRRFGS